MLFITQNTKYYTLIVKKLEKYHCWKGRKNKTKKPGFPRITQNEQWKMFFKTLSKTGTEKISWNKRKIATSLFIFYWEAENWSGSTGEIGMEEEAHWEKDISTLDWSSLFFYFLFGLPRKEELKTRRKKDTEEENNLHHNLNP